MIQFLVNLLANQTLLILIINVYLEYNVKIFIKKNIQSLNVSINLFSV